MVNERLRRVDNEKIKELLLRRYGVNLSHKLLTREGKVQLGRDIPKETLIAAQTGFTRDRDSYWKKNAPTESFGVQMVTWMGFLEGQAGLTQWVDRQTDPQVKEMLQEVGLVEPSKDKTKEDLKDPKVAALVAAINADLKRSGNDELKEEDLLEGNGSAARSLIFYSTYLNPDKEDGEDTNLLINTLVGKASSLNGNDSDKVIGALQNVSQLFRVAGEQGQHVLGALTVARAHALNSNDQLQQVPADAALKPEEQEILDFLKANTVSTEKALGDGKHNIQDTFARLTPAANPNQPYFVKDVPSDFTAKLTPEQVKALAIKKTFWNKTSADSLSLNPEVFKPVYDLKEDERFTTAEALTNNDSGLLALAAASAETPEKQAQLYKTLGETVLRVHTENPQLLQEFLAAQTEDSAAHFGEFEYERIRPQFLKGLEQQIALGEEFKQKYGIDLNAVRTPPNLTLEQQKWIQQNLQPLQNERLRLQHDISDQPGRLLAIDMYQVANAVNFLVAMPNVEETLKVWPDRVKALQEALQQSPIELTRDQIHQIEFLAHSVDTVQIINWMRMEQGLPVVDVPVAPAAPPPPSPVQPIPQAPETPTETTPEAQIEAEIASAETPPITLESFFQRLDNIETLSQSQRRDILAIQNPSNMETFSLSRNESITSFLILRGKDDLFFRTIRTPGSMSEFAYNGLQDKKGTEYSSHTYGYNTLLAYAIEATPTVSEQSLLVKNVFKQIAKFYKENRSLRNVIKDFFINAYQTAVNDPKKEQEIPPWNPKKVTEVFGTRKRMLERLSEISNRIEQNQVLGRGDFYDMGLFALPFNLEHVARTMVATYTRHHTQLPAAA